MKRRRFLWITAGLATVAAGTLGLTRVRRRGETNAPVPTGVAPEPPPPEQQGLYDDLRHYYRYLQIDDAVIWAYLRDLRRYRRRVSKRSARKQFLLSTDFFPNGADETRPIRYVQLYDPYIGVCYNPMA